MTEILPVPEHDFEAIVSIVANAYPQMQVTTPEDRERVLKRFHEMQQDPVANLYGAYRDGQAHGTMIYYDFMMQWHAIRTIVGGVGMVAVNLLHKKEKVARDMIADFIRHYDEKGVPLTMLYPFRPDFYKEMGFGYGTKKDRYTIKPSALPRGKSKEHLRFLTDHDREAVRACNDKFMTAHTGLVEKSDRDLGPRLLDNPKVRVIGYDDGAGLQGYMVFTFEKGSEVNFLKNNLVIHEMVYLNRDVLGEFLTFLHTQNDQIDRIILDTYDEFFQHVLADPRSDGDLIIPHVYHESHTSGVGLMYRISNVPRAFEVLAGHDFGGQSLTLKITLTDSFYPANAGSTTVRFEAGRPTVAPDAAADVEITLDVSEFSSMFMGVVPFKRLYEYGLAEISDKAYIQQVTRVFQTEEKPICFTAF